MLIPDKVVTLDSELQRVVKEGLLVERQEKFPIWVVREFQKNRMETIWGRLVTWENNQERGDVEMKQLQSLWGPNT